VSGLHVLGAILCAGFSRRMGRPKLLLPLKDGRPLVAHTIAQAAAARSVQAWCVTVNPGIPGVAEVVDRAERLWLPGRLRVLHVPEAGEGMAASLRAAAGEAKRVKADALLVLLGDQPGVSPTVIDYVVRRFHETQAFVVRTRYADGPGHPVLLASALYPELLQLHGDEGARSVVRRYTERTAWVEGPGPCPPDIDTMEDYTRLLGEAADTADKGAETDGRHIALDESSFRDSG
jgi:molybdenum cofactor cytidylyltransferase